ncbi:MAG TPA: glycosyltransferase [Chthoniobacteraceae bacterium]|nr:glycosyltransferase [Chthoniobacteraceae bacterium]
MIRVLHVIDSLDLGGAQTALAGMIKYCDRARFEPEVATMHGRGVFWEPFTALGVPVHSLSPRKWIPLFIPRFLRLVRKRRPHIVHCHLFAANWIAKPIAANAGVPVRINHDQCNDQLRERHRAALAMDTVTNRLSSHICAVSSSTRDFLIRRERISPARVSLVYNGVDLSRFTPRPRARSDGKLVVLGVGRLHPQKNFTLFLDAAAILAAKNPNALFRLAGTGPEEAKLRAHAAKLGIASRVEFLGHVSDTPALYADADVLLMTSLYEGTPLAILEAMATRVPIVARRVDGIAEILEDGGNALLCAGADPALFAEALEKLAVHRALRERLVAAAEEKVRASFSALAMARHVEAIYDRCLAEVRKQ